MNPVFALEVHFRHFSFYLWHWEGMEKLGLGVRFLCVERNDG